MSKDFDQWNIKKKQINQRKKIPFFKEREIWWCTLGLNIGTEQDGKGKTFQRPVLVLRKFSSGQFVGIPSTRSKKTGRFYHQIQTQKDAYNFILSQMRVFDAKRLTDRIITVPSKDIDVLKTEIKKLYGF